MRIIDRNSPTATNISEKQTNVVRKIPKFDLKKLWKQIQN